MITVVPRFVNQLVGSYYQLMSKGDPRTAEWPMMSSPFPTIGICLFFAYFAKKLGPAMMENRKPLQLRTVMVWYNFAMVIVSALLVYYFAISGWATTYSYKCQPVDYTNSKDGILMAKTAYAYYLVKFVEFLDTLFFILRKKYNQVSTLHVIHHGLMPFSVWWGIKFVPGGHATFFSFINSFIHVIMYTYYGLAALGPSVQKYLWWKKYLTMFQLVQFVMIFTHSFQLAFQSCSFPKIFMAWIGCHGLLFLFLFSHFYSETYTKPKKSSISSSLSSSLSSSSSSPQIKNDIDTSTQISENNNEHQQLTNNTKMAIKQD